MTPERWQKVAEAFEAALDLPPEDRSAFLRNLSSGDPTLASEVEALLTEDALQDQTPPSAIGATRLIGKRIGAYQVVRMIGEGGMGVVFEAEQEQPRRPVALKVLRPGLAIPELMRRFARESQVLARMQHPGIARIYEAGAAETIFGTQPYFAMEFIHGVPIVDYTQSHQLGTRQRLEIMAKTCDAVEHAHQRGIIHRDLKPGNILVEQDGQPKILDFGVARATDSDTQATRQTDVGQLIGTLSYMSPEQVLADPLELDTRSDVYALGVILYELLAHQLPYRLSNRLPEAVQTIREEDPKRLSSISGAYRGDVETIVAKALEKDKTRRYSSAAAMAGDIRRYLANQPITARPASTIYQLNKFARRHQALVAATAAVCVALVGGIIVSTKEAWRARQAEATAQAVNDFLRNDLLSQASSSRQAGPGNKPDRDLKVRTALDRAAARISGKFGRQPQVEAAIRETTGLTYMDLGLFVEARTQLERALELYRSAKGASAPETLKMLNALGRLGYLEGKFDRAEALFHQALEGQRRTLGPEHRDTIDSMNGLATVYFGQGKYPQAATLHKQALEIRGRLFGPQYPDTLNSANNLAVDYKEEGKYAEAGAILSQTLESMRRVMGNEHPDTLRALHNLALIYHTLGKYAQAEALYSQSVEIRRHVQGTEHPGTLLSMHNLANVYELEGKYAQSEALHRETFEIRQRVLGPEHPDTLDSMGDVARLLREQGKYLQAETMQNQALEAQRRVLGPDHPDTLDATDDLADTYAAQGKYEQAEAAYSQALQISRRVLGPDHPTTISFSAGLASLYQRQGKYDLAATYAARVLDAHRRSVGSEHPETMGAAIDLAEDYLLQGEFTASEPLAREAMKFNQAMQPDSWQGFHAESLLGASLAAQSQYTDARPLLLQGYEGMVARKNQIAVPDYDHLDRAREWLVKFDQARSKPETAAQWRKK